MPLSSSHPELLSFYVYRAQDDNDYHITNDNAANLPGVLKYVHYEVVGAQERGPDRQCRRHYGITRILRFKLTMKNPQKVLEYFGAIAPQLGPFSAFDKGACASCTDPNSPISFDKLGYYVGCQKQTDELYHYGETAAWFSLPGPCPLSEISLKTQQCMRKEPGGECPRGKVPDGVACTWTLEPAGEVRLDELSQIDDYFAFCNQDKTEYVEPGGVQRDTGHVCFWDDRNSNIVNAERVATVREFFKRKYPRMPARMLGPLCEF